MTGMGAGLTVGGTGGAVAAAAFAGPFAPLVLLIGMAGAAVGGIIAEHRFNQAVARRRRLLARRLRYLPGCECMDKPNNHEAVFKWLVANEKAIKDLFHDLSHI